MALSMRAAYDPNQPRDPAGTSTGGQWASGSGASTTMAQLNEKFPRAPQVVDGRVVLKDVPNTSSISGISDSYEELPGIREVQMSEFDPAYTGQSYSATENRRIDDLVDEIRASGKLKPLIVVIDHEKHPYILEGGHRFDALIRLRAKSFPAVVVVDTSLRKIRAMSHSFPLTPHHTARLLLLAKRRVEMRAAEWDEAKHPRVPGGSSTGGQWTDMAFHGSPSHDVTKVFAMPESRQYDNATSQLGAFFSPDAFGATHYAGKEGAIYKTDLTLEKPYEMPWHEFAYFQEITKDVDGKSLSSDKWADRQQELIREARELRKDLERKGHDGILVRSSRKVLKEIVVFTDQMVVPHKLSPEGEKRWRGLASRYPIRDAADRLAPAFSVALRAAFAVARKRLPTVRAAEFDESKHPRDPAGTSTGGQWTSGGKFEVGTRVKHQDGRIGVIKSQRMKFVDVEWVDGTVSTINIQQLRVEKLRSASDWVDSVVEALEGALGKMLVPLLTRGLVAGGESAALTLKVAEFDPNQPRDPAGTSTGGQWTDGGGSYEVPHVSNPDTSEVEANPSYAFFSKEADKWTRASDYEARQNAFDIAQRDDPLLGRALRKAYFGVEDHQLPTEVDLYRVGATQGGVASYFPRLPQAKAYQRRFGVDSIYRVSFDPRRLVPTGTGAGEIWADSDEALRRLRVAANRPQLHMVFNATNPRIAKWAKKHAAELIDGLAKVTKDWITEATTAHVDGELTDAEFSEALKAAVGDAARAEVIARTETMRAVHAGQREAWTQAIDQELLDKSLKRSWIVTADDRLCPICEPLDGAEAALDGLFAGEFNGPPAHPNCRCTEGLA